MKLPEIAAGVTRFLQIISEKKKLIGDKTSSD
jgi:hypothetical protein